MIGSDLYNFCCFESTFPFLCCLRFGVATFMTVAWHSRRYSLVSGTFGPCPSCYFLGQPSCTVSSCNEVWCHSAWHLGFSPLPWASWPALLPVFGCGIAGTPEFHNAPPVWRARCLGFTVRRRPAPAPTRPQSLASQFAFDWSTIGVIFSCWVLKLFLYLFSAFCPNACVYFMRLWLVVIFSTSGYIVGGYPGWHHLPALAEAFQGVSLLQPPPCGQYQHFVNVSHIVTSIFGHIPS